MESTGTIDLTEFEELCLDLVSEVTGEVTAYRLRAKWENDTNPNVKRGIKKSVGGKAAALESWCHWATEWDKTGPVLVVVEVFVDGEDAPDKKQRTFNEAPNQLPGAPISSNDPASILGGFVEGKNVSLEVVKIACGFYMTQMQGIREERDSLRREHKSVINAYRRLTTDLETGYKGLAGVYVMESRVRTQENELIRQDLMKKERVEKAMEGAVEIAGTLARLFTDKGNDPKSIVDGLTPEQCYLLGQACIDKYEKMNGEEPPDFDSEEG